jgi:hypothetical protein
MLLAAIGIVGCGGPPRPPEHPTYERVAVNQRAVGIPYGAVALFRVDDQLIALRVFDAPLWGFAIEYEWNVAPSDADIFETTATGSGQTDEKKQHGAVRAGPLYLNWSRGSERSGWLYWPEDSSSISVCSITFRSVESIDLQDPQIFWYTQEMFE